MSKDEGRILGIDYGSKRVGVAVSDPLRVIAQGVGTLDNDAMLMHRLGEIIQERSVVLVVVGIPYAADGGTGAKAKEVEQFIAELRRVVSLNIETWDESYSSLNARRAFIEGGMKRKKRQEKRRIDEMAARLLLQEYLENHDH